MLYKKNISKKYSQLILAGILIVVLALNLYFLNKITSHEKTQHNIEERIRR